jgi:hypothetical protein
MEENKKYQKVLEIAKLAKKLEDEVRERETEADVQASASSKLNEHAPRRNFVVEAKELLEKKSKVDDPC